MPNNVYSIYTLDKEKTINNSESLGNVKTTTISNDSLLLPVHFYVPIQVDTKPFNSTSFQEIGTTELNPKNYFRNNFGLEFAFEAILDIKNNGEHSGEIILFNISENKTINNSLLCSKLKRPNLQSTILKINDDLPNDSQIYSVQMRVNSSGVTVKCKMARIRISIIGEN